MGLTFTWDVSFSGPAAPPSSAPTTPGSQSGADGFRDWALDPDDGDLMIGDDGDAVFNTGADGIASDLQDCFKTWLGEWYLDTSLGFPWLQDVLGQRYDAALIRRDVTQLALSRPGVASVQGYVSTYDNVERVITIAFQVVCDFGALIDATLTATQGA